MPITSAAPSSADAAQKAAFDAMGMRRDAGAAQPSTCEMVALNWVCFAKIDFRPR
jgi:hypothetical protein